MTVKELIQKLQDYPQEMRVVVSGYEGGVNDMTEVNEIKELDTVPALKLS